MTNCSECYECPARKNSVFTALSDDEVLEMERVKRKLVFGYGELIFKEGQYPAGLYIITQGKVKIFKYGFEGREQIIKFAKTGGMLGYRSAVSEEPYTCSASAISETCLCFLPQDFIVWVLRKNPSLSIQFIKLLAGELKNAEEKTLQMAQKSVRERVAESLLLLKEVYGLEDDNATLNICLKREELAGLAGTVRETATRFLSEFMQEQIIELTGKKIKILNFRKLVLSANQFHQR